MHIDSKNKQYLECSEKMLECLLDCAKYGYGKIVIKARVTSKNKREVNIEYGRNYRFLISVNEINEVKAIPAMGALKQEYNE